MIHVRGLVYFGVLSALAATPFVGCGTRQDAPAPESQATDAWKAGRDPDVVAALSQLSDSDRQAALAQEVCPVTGKPLGSMGKPPKVTVEGQEVFLCCSGCEDELKRDPAPYLQKLEQRD